jgi:hypothetical protein
MQGWEVSCGFCRVQGLCCDRLARDTTDGRLKMQWCGCDIAVGCAVTVLCNPSLECAFRSWLLHATLFTTGCGNMDSGCPSQQSPNLIGVAFVMRASRCRCDKLCRWREVHRSMHDLPSRHVLHRQVSRQVRSVLFRHDEPCRQHTDGGLLPGQVVPCRNS